MSNLELVLNMLAEATTTEISQKENPRGLHENMKIARRGATVAGNARKQIELETGDAVITGNNARKVLK